MKSIVEYIEEAKQVSGSDYKTAQAMGVSRQAVSRVRSGYGMTPEHAVLLADLIGADRMEVIAASEVAKRPGSIEFWAKCVAGFAIMAVGVTAFFPEISAGYEQASFGGLYIMRNVDSVIWFLCLVAILPIIRGSGFQTWRFLRL